MRNEINQTKIKIEKFPKDIKFSENFVKKRNIFENVLTKGNFLKIS